MGFNSSRHIPEWGLDAFGACQPPLFQLPAACLNDVSLICLLPSKHAGVPFQPNVPNYEKDKCDMRTCTKSVISISQQLEYFKEYKERLKQAKGQVMADEIIAEALYIFSIGTNDFFVNYYVMPLRAVKYTPTEYAAYLVGLAEDAVRQAYELGARKVMLSGIPPFGCVPAARTMNREAPGECNEEYNRVAQSYNAGVREAVGRLGAELAGARVVYLDVYDVPNAIFSDPSEYGFENVARGCCGTGLIETTVLCGMDVAFTCQDADKYVFFDSVHPSQRTYKLLADEIIKTTLQVFLV